MVLPFVLIIAVSLLEQHPNASPDKLEPKEQCYKGKDCPNKPIFIHPLHLEPPFFV
jgi:hypothetical protein